MQVQTSLTLVEDQAPSVAAEETFDGTWPFKAHYTDAPGFRMHYVGEGSNTLLLLHGEPTWGYLFRHQIPIWSKHARVIAPDHMGFGKSATPQDRTYWLQDHIDMRKCPVSFSRNVFVTHEASSWGTFPVVFRRFGRPHRMVER